MNRDRARPFQAEWRKSGPAGRLQFAAGVAGLPPIHSSAHFAPERMALELRRALEWMGGRPATPAAD
jgi:hypothetical protein